MIECETMRTATEPNIELAHRQNGQTAKRLTVTTDKCIAGCMSLRKTMRITGELTVQYIGCTFEQPTGQAYTQLYLCMANRINGQLTALAAISIIN